ncbi:hypothetical protein [Schaalia sp. ZJ1691]|nr:hypothetical protein [Schaalia sp. ZJ1691]
MKLKMNKPWWLSFVVPEAPSGGLQDKDDTEAIDDATQTPEPDAG